MVQAVLTYLAVAAAALWVVWSVLLPKPAKRALRLRFMPQKATPAGKASCDCGDDGGCH
jgi:hypothetical protein